MSIIVTKNGKDARILGKSTIKSEAYLQEYIRNNTNCSCANFSTHWAYNRCSSDISHCNIKLIHRKVF